MSRLLCTLRKQMNQREVAPYGRVARVVAVGLREGEVCLVELPEAQVRLAHTQPRRRARPRVAGLAEHVRGVLKVPALEVGRADADVDVEGARLRARVQCGLVRHEACDGAARLGVQVAEQHVRIDALGRAGACSASASV